MKIQRLGWSKRFNAASHFALARYDQELATTAARAGDCRAVARNDFTSNRFNGLTILDGLKDSLAAISNDARRILNLNSH